MADVLNLLNPEEQWGAVPGYDAYGQAVMQRVPLATQAQIAAADRSAAAAPAAAPTGWHPDRTGADIPIGASMWANPAFVNEARAAGPRMPLSALAPASWGAMDLAREKAALDESMRGSGVWMNQGGMMSQVPEELVPQYLAQQALGGVGGRGGFGRYNPFEREKLALAERTASARDEDRDLDRMMKIQQMKMMHDIYTGRLNLGKEALTQKASQASEAQKSKWRNLGWVPRDQAEAHDAGPNSTWVFAGDEDGIEFWKRAESDFMSSNLDPFDLSLKDAEGNPVKPKPEWADGTVHKAPDGKKYKVVGDLLLPVLPRYNPQR